MPITFPPAVRAAATRSGQWLRNSAFPALRRGVVVSSRRLFLGVIPAIATALWNLGVAIVVALWNLGVDIVVAIWRHGPMYKLGMILAGLSLLGMAEVKIFGQPGLSMGLLYLVIVGAGLWIAIRGLVPSRHRRRRR